VPAQKSGARTVTDIEQRLRELAPIVLAALLRSSWDFETSEDAVQEALLAAAVQWPGDGVPGNPAGWLITVASRRRIELWRSDTARRRREETAARAQTPEPEPAPAVDDTLTLLLLCCHPCLTPPSQVALTLRAVGGLTTAEIARAFLVPEATVAQRISRAKQRIKASGGRFGDAAAGEIAARLPSVLRVLYLIFNEGYTASSGVALHRVELTREAIRLTRALHGKLPDDGEVTGLLALMLLTDARRPARTGPDGELVPLADQDRDRWDADAIAEGIGLITGALAVAPIGPYQLQAAIAAVHGEARRASDTDWLQILGLYELLDRMAPGPMVTLNRIVAVAMVNGPRAGLRELADAEADPGLTDHHRLHAVRAHLLERAGERRAAVIEYQTAARRTLSIPERRHLQSRAALLSSAVDQQAGEFSARSPEWGR
jgi:RNA polymerase sigma factor (sigma-70 family)